MPSRKLILFEANEVPFRVMDRYCKENPKSALAQHLPACHQFETHDVPFNPNGVSESVSAWPTAHRGINQEHHGISNFNQDLAQVDQRYPPIWRFLSQRQMRVGVFGSFHSYQSFPEPEERGGYDFYVPDVFSPDDRVHPTELKPFQKYNLAMTRASARNVSHAVQWSSGLRLLAGAPKLGVRPRTLLRLGRQLAAESLAAWKSTRRRSHQVSLAFDIFMKQLQRKNVDFCTFFSNHIAAAMHRYWAAAFPEDFATSEVSEEWKQRYRREIDYAMKIFSECFGELIEFVNRNPDYRLIVASCIGQAARASCCCRTELFLTDLSRFVGALGLSPEHCSSTPAMIPMFNVTIVESERDRFRECLQRLYIGGDSVGFAESDNGLFSLHLGQPDLSTDALVYRGERNDFADFGLTNVEIDDRSARSGYHVSVGSLLVYDTQQAAPTSQRVSVSLLDLCPSIISNFGFPAPDYMQGQQIDAIAN